jgi:hypothetical protein
MHKKNWYLIHVSHFPFHRKMYVYSPAGSVPPLSHLTSCTSTKSNLNVDIYFTTVMSEHALYRLLTFHVRNLVSIFLCLVHVYKESVQVWNPLWHFVGRVISPTPNPPRWRFQYICT